MTSLFSRKTSRGTRPGFWKKSYLLISGGTTDDMVRTVTDTESERKTEKQRNRTEKKDKEAELERISEDYMALRADDSVPDRAEKD